MLPMPVLDELLADARARGAVVARPNIGTSLGPRRGVSWLTVLAIDTDPPGSLDPLYRRGGGSCPYTATCRWTAHHDLASGEAWVLLEVVLRTRDEHTVLVPFDDLGLHGQVLRDTITAGWLVLLDAGDTDSLHALDRADFDVLEASWHVELPNTDTGPLQRLFEGLGSGCCELSRVLTAGRRGGPGRAGRGLRADRSTRRA